MLSQQAYAQPPIAPTGLALTLVIIILIFTVLSTIVVALRIYVRAWMGKSAGTWGWEDTFIVLGYVSIWFKALDVMHLNLRSPQFDQSLTQINLLCTNRDHFCPVRYLPSKRVTMDWVLMTQN